MSAPTVINLNDSTPAAPSGQQNVKWQGDSSNPRNVSAYFPPTGTVNAQSGTSYTLQVSDRGKIIKFNNSSAVAATLPAASGLPANFMCWIVSVGTGTVTLTPASGTIDGLTSATLGQYGGLALFGDGTNYWTMRGSAPAGVTSLDSITGAITLVAGSNITITDNSPSAGDITIAATGGSGGGLVGLITPATIVTPGSSAGYTLYNAGATGLAVANNSGGALWVKVTTASANDVLNFAAKALGSAPWTIVAGWIPFIYNTGSSDGTSGLIIAESATKKTLIISRDSGSLTTGVVKLVQRWPDYTSASGVSMLQSTSDFHYVPIEWRKVVNDGTNLTVYDSPDGQSWFQIYTTTVAAVFTTAPDLVGFGFDCKHSPSNCLAIHLDIT